MHNDEYEYRTDTFDNDELEDELQFNDDFDDDVDPDDNDADDDDEAVFVDDDNDDDDPNAKFIMNASAKNEILLASPPKWLQSS